MAISNKVQTEQDWMRKAHFHRDYMIVPVGRKFRIYEDGTSYSQTSGQTINKGKAVRRYDPDAREQEGKYATFTTVEECEQYIDRWLS